MSRRRNLPQPIVTPPSRPTREEVWLRAWCATANATTCPTTIVATKWANDCLEQYDKLFTNPNTQQ